MSRFTHHCRKCDKMWFNNHLTSWCGVCGAAHVIACDDEMENPWAELDREILEGLEQMQKEKKNERINESKV